MSEKGSIIGGVLVGILVGTIVGAAAALLSAPQPGQQTRALIREKSSEIRDRASTTLRDSRSRANSVLADVKARSQEFAGHLRRSNGTQITAEIVAE